MLEHEPLVAIGVTTLLTSQHLGVAREISQNLPERAAR
jgi:hypothetical protein